VGSNTFRHFIICCILLDTSLSNFKMYWFLWPFFKVYRMLIACFGILAIRRLRPWQVFNYTRLVVAAIAPSASLMMASGFVIAASFIFSPFFQRESELSTKCKLKCLKCVRVSYKTGFPAAEKTKNLNFKWARAAARGRCYLLA